MYPHPALPGGSMAARCGVTGTAYRYSINPHPWHPFRHDGRIVRRYAVAIDRRSHDHHRLPIHSCERLQGPDRSPGAILVGFDDTCHYP